MFAVEDPKQFHRAMQQLRTRQPRAIALLDLAAERIYQSRSDNRDGMASALTHVAALLGEAKNPRYRSVLEQVRAATSSRGVRKWTKRALKQIPQTDTVQYQLGSTLL